MGVRPPQSNSGDDGPEVIEFGIAEVAAELDEADLSFPATGAEVVSTLSDPRIDYNAKGHAVALSEALSELDRDRFESEQELLNALHPVFERYRNSRSPGVIERVRAALPL
ncbi:hypothetical protein NGM10_15140 [Halorussus salilacus]|uniref:DUF5789 family protein n=1 Tax=Halorussus salilacus TaxID=2953750 RepID=UPI0020A006E3|nr:hypothetical protein [Halorussus salilacus]USZ68055.1 hypothetical protein NGM10_15140 [Halorussus salilacus]